MAARQKAKALRDQLAGNQRAGLEALRSSIADEIETAKSAGRSTSALYAQLRLVLRDLAQLREGDKPAEGPPPADTGGVVRDIAERRANRIAGADAAAPARRRGNNRRG